MRRGTSRLEQSVNRLEGEVLLRSHAAGLPGRRRRAAGITGWVARRHGGVIHDLRDGRYRTGSSIPRTLRRGRLIGCVRNSAYRWPASSIRPEGNANPEIASLAEIEDQRHTVDRAGRIAPPPPSWINRR